MDKPEREWDESDQLNADAACAVLTGARKTLRGASTGNTTPKPHDVEVVRGVRLSIIGATHYVAAAARGWNISDASIDALVTKMDGVVHDLKAWVEYDEPRRVVLRRVFARYERLHDAIIAIGDGSLAPKPRGEGGDGGGGDGGGK